MDKLKEHVERWKRNSDSARINVKLGDLRDMIDRLEGAEKALEPFAMEADDWSEDQNDGFVFDDERSISQGDGNLTIGHLRTARAHMEKYHGR